MHDCNTTRMRDAWTTNKGKRLYGNRKETSYAISRTVRLHRRMDFVPSVSSVVPPRKTFMHEAPTISKSKNTINTRLLQSYLYRHLSLNAYQAQRSSLLSYLDKSHYPIQRPKCSSLTSSPPSSHPSFSRCKSQPPTSIHCPQTLPLTPPKNQKYLQSQAHSPTTPPHPQTDKIPVQRIPRLLLGRPRPPKIRSRRLSESAPGPE